MQPPPALYEEAPCGLLVTTPEGLITRVNQTFCTWVGRAAVELVGQVRLQDLLTVGGRIFHHTHWGPLMQIQGSVAEVKLEVVHQDGRKLPMVLNAVRRTREGIAVHEVAAFIAEDRHKYEQELLAERRRAVDLLALEQRTREALRDAQIERDRQQALAEDRALFAEQMMAIVSHDLRNPLSVIQLNASLLAKTGLNAQQQAALGRLVRSNERASRLISDLLDFSRGRQGAGLQVELRDIDFHAVVAEALGDLRVTVPGRVIEHRREGDGGCSGSSDRLTQLIGNLVANAIAYGLPDRPVIVTSRVEEAHCALSVHNEGSPIPDALLPLIFDPMKRGTPTAGPRSSVGLGLFIVRQIAQAHGGEVTVTSTHADGTTFTARFARKACAARAGG